MPEAPVTVTTKGLRGLLGYAAQRGVKPSDVLAYAGIHEDQIADSDARVERDAWARAWQAVSERLDCPAIAMHVARSLPFGAFDVLDYIAATSPNVEEGLLRVLRYFRLIHDGVEPRLERQGDVAVLHYHSNDDSHPAVTLSVEFTFACFLLRFRRNTGVHWAPRFVEFRHARPAADPIYTEVFASPVRFGQDANRFVFDASVLALPVQSADPLLNQVLQRHASELLERLPSVVGFRDEVVRAIRTGLLDGEPGAEAVARSLGLTVRTLQRRLKDEEVTFQQLVDETRLELAESMLADPSMAIAEIGFILGFSEPSAFHRAFRRWTGSTPGEFRRARVSG